mmetsp:Transcript_503/g.1534  ORF Transcript_503/g.1534 Transcript_503/m.1534 type:complete len:382 (-) Transcript_503:73-1218(-)
MGLLLDALEGLVEVGVQDAVEELCGHLVQVRHDQCLARHLVQGQVAVQGHPAELVDGGLHGVDHVVVPPPVVLGEGVELLPEGRASVRDHGALGSLEGHHLVAELAELVRRHPLLVQPPVEPQGLSEHVVARLDGPRVRVRLVLLEVAHQGLRLAPGVAPLRGPVGEEQGLHSGPVPGARPPGVVQGRVPKLVLRVDGHPCLVQKPVHCGHAAVGGGEVQGRAAVVVREAHFAAVLEQAAQLIHVVRGRRGAEVVRLVEGAQVRAGLEQRLAARVVVRHEGVLQGGRAALVHAVHGGLAAQEQLHVVQVAPGGGEVQRRPAVAIGHVHVALVLHEVLELVVTVRNGRGRAERLRGVLEVALRVVLEQHTHGLLLVVAQGVL